MRIKFTLVTRLLLFAKIAKLPKLKPPFAFKFLSVLSRPVKYISKPPIRLNFKYFVSAQRIKCAKILQNGGFMRNYDKEHTDKPLIVENNWFLRAEITGIISCIIFFCPSSTNFGLFLSGRCYEGVF